MSHNLKKVAHRYDVPVVFSEPNKLAQLCPRIMGASKTGCQVKHATPYTRCATGVVYELPLTCGKSYVGQTGRCVNDRMREHANNLKKDFTAHLSAHCKTCSCVPRFNDVRILGRNHDKTARELLEAFYIKEKNDNCVSQTSVFLYNAERNFFKSVI